MCPGTGSSHPAVGPWTNRLHFRRGDRGSEGHPGSPETCSQGGLAPWPSPSVHSSSTPWGQIPALTPPPCDRGQSCSTAPCLSFHSRTTGPMQRPPPPPPEVKVHETHVRRSVCCLCIVGRQIPARTVTSIPLSSFTSCGEQTRPRRGGTIKIPTFNANQNHSGTARHPTRTAGIKVITTRVGEDVEKLEASCGWRGRKMPHDHMTQHLHS